MLRTPSFFIRDLNSAREGFVQKNVKSSDVFLCGAVTQLRVEVIENLQKRAFIYTISDPSGCIDCILEVPTEKPSDPFAEIDAKNLKTADPTDPLVAFCLANQFPSKPDGYSFEPGVWVKIIGVVETKENAYVKVKRIHKLRNLQQRINYFKDLIHLYCNVYNKE